MTKDRDAKRIARARATKTGESYVTAKRHTATRRGADTEESDGNKLFKSARSHPAPELVEQLEARIAQGDGGPEERAQLLGFYFMRISGETDHPFRRNPTTHFG